MRRGTKELTEGYIVPYGTCTLTFLRLVQVRHLTHVTNTTFRRQATSLGINLASISDLADLTELRRINAVSGTAPSVTVVTLADAIILLRHYKVSEATIIALEEHNRASLLPRPSERRGTRDRQGSVMSSGHMAETLGR